MACNRKCFTATWRIENYNYCLVRLLQFHSSPQFVIDVTNNISCSFELYPRSCFQEDHISFYVKKLGNQDVDFDLDIETSFFVNDTSSPLYERSLQILHNKGVSNCRVPHQKVYFHKTDVYIPPEILTIRCRMFKSTGSFAEAGQCFIRTRFRVEKTAFIGFTEKFSRLMPDEKRALTIKSASNEKQILNLNVSLAGDQCCKERIWIEVIPMKENYIKFGRCKIFILDSEGKKTECGKSEILFNGGETGKWKFPLNFTKSHLMNRGTQFLSNDVLTLKCEFEFSTGIEYDQIEDSEYGNRDSAAEIRPKLPSAVEDLSSLYEEGILCDMKMKTETETFNVHKAILSARSSVFKRMFTSDMRENITDCVVIEDLDADTVRRMLLFVYSDNLKDLDWTSAKDLYFAADKYNIVALKRRCADFLKGNLQPSNCCDLLLLSDQLQDKELKKSMHDYIAENHELILQTETWMNLERTNPVLTTEIYRALYSRIWTK